MATPAATSSSRRRRDAPAPTLIENARLGWLLWTGLAGGLALFTALVVASGVGEIARTLAAAGGGVLWLVPFHLVPLAASALAWRAVLVPLHPAPLRTTFRLRWISESINQLLPAVHVGGNVVRARRLAQSGVPGPLAAASVIVDVTLHLVAQLLFTLAGTCLLLVEARGRSLAGRAAVGLCLAAVGAASFFTVQRRGLFRASAVIVRRVFRSAPRSSRLAGVAATDVCIRRLYGDRRAVVVAGCWHVLSWVLGVGETALALRLLGHPVPPATAVVIEGVGEAIRTAAFPVPGALGVQEGSLVVLGGLFGLTPEVALALSLAKRVRELALGIPGLIVWQATRPTAAVARR
jgi:putative membrane protein